MYAYIYITRYAFTVLRIKILCLMYEKFMVFVYGNQCTNTLKKYELYSLRTTKIYTETSKTA